MKAKQPRDLRCPKIVPKVTHRQVSPQLVQDFIKAQAFSSQPPGKCSLAAAKQFCDNARGRLGVRQERCIGIFDNRAKWAGIRRANGHALSRNANMTHL